MEIVTGYKGQPHVTAENWADLNRGIIGSDSYVLSVGRKFESELVSNNLLKIRDGAALIQGRQFVIPSGQSDEITIENGTQGEKRTDLIVARYTKKNDTKVEEVAPVYIKGTPSASDPVFPDYNTDGDIRAGDLTADMPLYALDLEGINVVAVRPLFNVLESAAQLNSKIEVLQDTDSTSESAIASDGRALKIYDSDRSGGGNVTYGCWNEGMYSVRPYTPGAPSNWGGMCFVTHVRESSGAFNSYLKTFFSSDCKVYVMRQAKDGTVEQNWMAQS